MPPAAASPSPSDVCSAYVEEEEEEEFNDYVDLRGYRDSVSEGLWGGQQNTREGGRAGSHSGGRALPSDRFSITRNSVRPPNVVFSIKQRMSATLKTCMHNSLTK